MIGYCNRGKVVKKTVKVPKVSRGPVLQSFGNLLDPGSRNQSRNSIDQNDENGLESAMTMPAYQLVQEPILLSVSFCYF